MKYQSTRGQVTGITFEEALCSGFVQDGGMVMPEEIPVISEDTLTSWSGLSYTDLAKKITRMFVAEDEMPQGDLFGLIDAAVLKINHPDTIPVARLAGGLNVLELFHGKTWAFKDIPLAFVAEFLSYFLSKRKKHLTLLIATSGDTGSAAVQSVRSHEWIDAICMFPRGRCTKVQELQMTTVTDDNVHIYRCEGTSDDFDMVMKVCFQDVPFARKHNLSTLNSFNWARIMLQIVHFFHAYFQVCHVCGEEVEIVLPTGGCGNLVAGCIARKMGLPIKIVCTVNKNDIVARIIEKGDFSTEPVQMTLAPAMDIQLPLNMERVLFLVSDGDWQLVSQLMTQFEKTGSTQVPDLLKQKIQSVVSAFVVSDEVITTTMKKCWDENSYLICPHTATALAYHYHKLQQPGSDDKRPQICLATASPAKFQDAVAAAGLALPPNDAVLKIESLPTRCEDLNKGADWEMVLRQKVEEISNAFLARNVS